MKILLTALLVTPLCVGAQHLAIGTDADYTVIKHTLQDSVTKKPCISYNLLTKKKPREVLAGGDNYFINILFFPANNTGNAPAGRTYSVIDLLKSLPPTPELLQMNLADYSVARYTPNFRLDSVLVVQENGVQKTLRGIVYTRIYLLRSFGQVTPLQTNNFLLNVRAKKTKISHENGVPYIVEKNAYCDYDNKLFLVDEVPATGVMYMHKTARSCRDCAFAEQAEEFTFDPLKGIVSIKCYVPGITGKGFERGVTYFNFK